MSVAVKSVHSRRIKPKVPRPDIFYIYDEDANSTDSNKSDKNKCASNGTQTKNDHRLRTPHTLQKCVVPRKKLKKKIAKIMDWKKYHRLNVIYSFIENLEKDFPAICTVTVIGKSVEGRDIKMLKVSNSNADNLGVWIDACIHPREWITTAVVTYIANELVRNFHKFSDAVTNTAIHAQMKNSSCISVVNLVVTQAIETCDNVNDCSRHIVPVLNPDGYEYTHTHDRMWRKNRAKYEGECVGVDLNRNFSYAWGQNPGNEGSSDEPTHVFYRGPIPFSEPESTAVRDTILGSITPFKVFLSFHSYYELIIFPWGNRTDPCPDYVRLLEGGTIMARTIFETSGKTYKVGSTKDLTYSACGTSIDWSYSIAKIPYSYMVELRSKKHKFRLPKDQILETCTEAWNAVQKLLDYVDEH